MDYCTQCGTGDGVLSSVCTMCDAAYCVPCSVSFSAVNPVCPACPTCCKMGTMLCALDVVQESCAAWMSTWDGSRIARDAHRIQTLNTRLLLTADVNTCVEAITGIPVTDTTVTSEEVTGNLLPNVLVTRTVAQVVCHDMLENGVSGYMERVWSVVLHHATRCTVSVALRMWARYTLLHHDVPMEDTIAFINTFIPGLIDPTSYTVLNVYKDMMFK